MVQLLADALIVLGTLIMTFGVVGILRAPTVYTRLHAASKSVVMGVVSFCAASFLNGVTPVQTRVVLIAIFLVLTTPVASHVVAQSAFRTGED
jgi:multicomponent Na+:H+ antiporter subunit G